MRKFLVIFVCTVLFLTACGKDDKNRDDYENVDHTKVVEVDLPPTTSTPTKAVEVDLPPATPTVDISTEGIMNSYHRDENVLEVEFDIVCAIAYDDPYSGKPLGYLVNEKFTTTDFFWADHDSKVGFSISCIKNLYMTDDAGIIHPIELPDDADGVIWVRDGDAIFNLVPHPENYDGTDWGS